MYGTFAQTHSIDTENLTAALRWDQGLASVLFRLVCSEKIKRLRAGKRVFGIARDRKNV